ncbi:MAG: gamma-glutamylcyclotransferase [Armatimonadetes bacterium]|nr:gamma-glutamylcyclotransferase [Armatimonadota bacterium]
MIQTDKLFVHGTLATPRHLRVLTGFEPPRRPALLHDFRRVPTPHALPHILPEPGATTEGYLIEGIDAEVLARLDRYEENGSLYERRPVVVRAGGEWIQTHAYVGSPTAIGVHPCRDFEPEDRVEYHLLAEMESTLARRFGSAESDIRLGRELLGDAIAELTRKHWLDPRWSPRALGRALQHAPLPSLEWLREDAHARRFASAYLRLIARIVILNQVEDRIRSEFRQALRPQASCYPRTESLLAALAFLNARAEALEAALAGAGLRVYQADYDYVDTVRQAILLADALYDRSLAAEIIARMKINRRPGGTPLGAELEFSPLGARAIRSRRGADPQLDGLYYFHDFDLARRLWKLGGYRDDHTGVTFDAGRTRGFLEIAIGRLQAEGDLSQPATTDLWILSELIRETVEFIGIPPHSLHLSLQAEEGRPFTRLPGPEFLFCLLLLGGDLGLDTVGILREKRIHGGEIRTRRGELAFSRWNAHRAVEGGQPPVPVIEFTFPRLAAGRHYEPLLFALKGLQRALNPLPLVGPNGPLDRRYYRQMEQALLQWAAAPTPVDEGIITEFIDVVATGLRMEREAGHGHSPGECADGLIRVEAALHERNEEIRRISSQGLACAPTQGA